MTSVQEGNVGIHFGWDLGESGWNLQMNANLLSLGSLALIGVVSATVTAPPGSPTNGVRYLVPSSGVTGAWVGEENKIAVYDGNSSLWLTFTPKDTWNILARDTGQWYVHNGTNWVFRASLLSQYADDAAANTGGVPVNGEYINSSTGALTVRRT